MSLADKNCTPCEEGGDPMDSEQVEEYLDKVNTDWELMNSKKIFRSFDFADYEEVMKFVNKVADLADQEGHHPDMHVSYDEVVVEIWTHAVGGLTENDFILAKKIDSITQ